MSRFYFALKTAYAHRQMLAKIRRGHTISHVTHLSLEYLKSQDIQAVVLDFDGVLSPHGETLVASEVVPWLNQLLTQFEGKVFVWSNKPFKARANALKMDFPKIHWVSGYRKKPYPEGLKAICQEHQLAADQVIMVDDRLLTGVLSAVQVGTQVAYVYPALRNVKRKPIVERFFEMLRRLERAIF